MEKRIVIRNENPSDYDKVEALTREAFYYIHSRMRGALSGAYHERPRGFYPGAGSCVRA